MLACIDGDKQSATRLMSRLGDAPAENIWGSSSLFEKYRQWCFVDRKYESQLAINAHVHEITDVIWSNDSKLLYTTSRDRNGQIKIWDAQTGNLVRALPGRDHLRSLAISPDGKSLAVAGGQIEGFFEVWDLETLAPTLVTNSFKQTVRDCQYSSTGLLAAVSLDGDIKLWNAKEGTPYFEYSSMDRLQAFGFSPNGQLMVAASGHGQVLLFDVEQKQKTRHIVAGGDLDDVAMSNDLLALTGADWRFALFDLVSGESVLFPIPRANKVAFSQNGRLLAVGARDDDPRSTHHGAISIWDVMSRKRLKLFSGHTEDVTKLAFSPDDHWLEAPAKTE